MSAHIATREGITEIKTSIRRTDAIVSAIGERVNGLHHNMMQMLEDMERMSLQATRPHSPPPRGPRARGCPELSTCTVGRLAVAPRSRPLGGEKHRLCAGGAIQYDQRRDHEALEVHHANHRVSAEVLRAQAGDTKYISDCIKEDLIAAKFRVRGAGIRSSAEKKPDRIRALTEFSKQNEAIAKLNPGCIFETCQRTLDIWDKSATVRLPSRTRPPCRETRRRHRVAGIAQGPAATGFALVLVEYATTGCGMRLDLHRHHADHEGRPRL